jgi:DNA-binding response OmpR family regulator
MAMAAATDYDLVIADATLAAPSGRPFVQELRESDARWADRLIAVGGRNEDRRVSKPFDLRRLRSLADEVLGARSVSTPPPVPDATARS